MTRGKTRVVIEQMMTYDMVNEPTYEIYASDEDDMKLFTPGATVSVDKKRVVTDQTGKVTIRYSSSSSKADVSDARVQIEVLQAAVKLADELADELGSELT